MTPSRRFPSVLVLLLAGGIGLVACFCLQAGQRSDLSSSQDFSLATEVREIEVEVNAGARSVEVRANIHIEHGQARFQLFDPAGAERLSGAVASGDAKWESGVLPAVAGTWRAQFVLERATGDLRVRSRVR